MTHLTVLEEDRGAGLALVQGPGRRYFLRETLADGRMRLVGKGHSNLGVAKARFEQALGLRRRRT